VEDAKEQVRLAVEEWEQIRVELLDNFGLEGVW
jgi:hypothetical protein